MYSILFSLFLSESDWFFLALFLSGSADGYREDFTEQCGVASCGGRSMNGAVGLWHK